jgi:hypothetical protein
LNKPCSKNNNTLPKFAASLVCPVDSPPRRNAVVEVDNFGVIISVSDGSSNFRESAGIAYYSGILIPGLADLMTGSGDNPHWQYSRGIRVAGAPYLPDVADAHTKETVALSPVSISKKEPSRNESAGFLSGDTDDLPRKGRNFYNLAAGRYRWKGMYGEVVDYFVYDGMNHYNRFLRAGLHEGLYHAQTGKGELPVLATGGRIEMMRLMFELQEGAALISFEVLLEMASLNGAIAAGYEKTAGSLSKGKQPGLCIIEGADIANIRLLKGSRLRRLL